MDLQKRIIFPKISFFLLLISTFLAPKTVFANQKYATIVNPIRSRDLWKVKTLSPIDNQYKIINDLQLKATWLIQDDVFSDQDLIKKLKDFDSNQEFGLFLEVSRSLTKKSRVYYPTETPWYSPKAVFLSAYDTKDRQKIIDQMVISFQKTFGYLPKSAGAWWIDSWTQQYLEKKYQITNLMIVADQKTTDNYGVWGQWWGYPYHPSSNNILTPGISPTVVIQWAQRDLTKAYQGAGPLVSNYSLQANDYLSLGLDFKHFQNLANQYLNVNPLGQITVGLETGMESVGYESEYKKQLNWIKENQITSLTMGEFGDIYRTVYQNQNPQKIILGDWELTPEYRSNQFLTEKTTYNPNFSFKDKFVADKSEFLDRVLTPSADFKNINFWPYFLLFILLLWWWSKNLIPILWLVILYLPIFRSFYSSGWKIFFGPSFGSLISIQILILILGSILVTKINQKYKINWSSWFSVWIFNFIVFTARFSIIDGRKYLGFLIDNFRFIGIAIGRGIHFINQDLTDYVAATMLKFNQNWIWSDWYTWLIIYPLIEISLVLLINKYFPKKIRYVLSFLSVFFIIYLFNLSPLSIK